MIPIRVASPAPLFEQPVQPIEIALVNAPFASTKRPSIQCGLLKAILRRGGHNVDVHYLNVDLARRLGGKLYFELTLEEERELFLGDWIFSVAAFGDAAPGDADAYGTLIAETDAFSQVRKRGGRSFPDIGNRWSQLCDLRNRILPEIADEWATAIDWGRYRIVGFTSTFEQNAASLAVAKRIKARHPTVVTLFGGANFDAVMGPELVRNFDQIDYAVIGEGDHAIVRIAAAISKGESPLGIPGVIGRSNGTVTGAGRASNVETLDNLPDPDYDDYFKALRGANPQQITNGHNIALPIEASRGCWWGQKHHCTFCGLNGETMSFRSKSPERVMDELARLSQRYKMLAFEAVDNIMDMRYISQLCEPLSEKPWDYSIFYEVKANLNRQQLRAMSGAGISLIQPGIESLSTHVLQLMRKGTTAIQNVRVLKWARYYHISVMWNILTGFPGETIEDYEYQYSLIPLLYHLRPPSHVGRLWLERFSPFFTDSNLGFKQIRPKPAYGHIYPASVDLDKVAYFFDYDVSESDTAPESIVQKIAALVDHWKELWRNGDTPTTPKLMYQRGSPGWLKFIDTRSGTGRVSTISGIEALAYELCGDREQTPRKVAQALTKPSSSLSEERARELLDDFCERGLMFRDNDRYLALALPKRKGESSG